MRVVRGQMIVADRLSYRLPADLWRSLHGSSLSEVKDRANEVVGLEVEGETSIQVIPVAQSDQVEVRIQDR